MPADASVAVAPSAAAGSGAAVSQARPADADSSLAAALAAASDDDDDAGGGADEEEDESLAAAIALSMAAAAEESKSNSSEPVAGTPAGPSASVDGSVKPATAAAAASLEPSASSPSSSSASSSRLVTEPWFDAYCIACSVLDCLTDRSRALPLPLALSAVDGGVSSPTAPASAVRLATAHALIADHSSGAWSAAHDVELIAFANDIEHRLGTRLIQKMGSANWLKELSDVVSKSNAARNRFALLRQSVIDTEQPASNNADSNSSTTTSSSSNGNAASSDDFSTSAHALLRRLSLLLLLNWSLSASLSLIDLNCSSSGASSSLSHRVSFYRGCVLRSVKSDYLYQCLEATCLDGEALSRKLKPKVVVDRLKAAAHEDLKHSLFEQLRTQLQHVPMAHLMQPAPVGNPHTAFNVTFQGQPNDETDKSLMARWKKARKMLNVAVSV
jgi:hypothetical protein